MRKEELLQKLRANTKVQYDMPAMDDLHGITYAEGGRIMEARKTDDLNQIIRNLYPDAKIFASNLPYISIAQRNPDTVAEAQDLNGTDVGVVEGQLGVAENACIWVPQTMKEKAVCFISEYLVIILDKQNIVNNMHEAYRRIEMDPRYNFGTFISGPSKTAHRAGTELSEYRAGRAFFLLSFNQIQ